MSNKERLIKLEFKQNNNRSRNNEWMVTIVKSSGEVVDRYRYPSREKVVNEH
jgi:hypothetical protein